MDFTRLNRPGLLAAVVAATVAGRICLGSMPAFLVLPFRAGFRPRMLVVVGTIVFDTIRRDIPTAVCTTAERSVTVAEFTHNSHLLSALVEQNLQPTGRIPSCDPFHE